MTSRALRCGFLVCLIGILPRVARAADVTINWNDVRQEITGFGSGWENELGRFAMALPEDVRAEMMTLLFDTVQGIGLTYVRTHLPPDLLDEAGNWNWDSYSGRVAGYAMDQVRLMQESQAAGNCKFWFAPWAGVPMWKANPVYGGGGGILQSHWQDYADYMSRFIREYKTRFGIEFMGVSVQNEPHFDPSYGGCPWTGTQIRDFIKNNLGPTLERDSIDIKIIAPESNWNQEEWAEPSLNDPEAMQYLDVVAFHQYEASVPSYVPQAIEGGKEVWMSEISSYSRDDDWPAAIGYADQIWDNLVTAEASSWQFWWFYDGFKCNSGFLGPYENGQIVKKRLYYWIGHYSKFVRPGYRRITTTPSSVRGPNNGARIGVCAFRDPVSGRFAMVVNNPDYTKPQNPITFHFNDAVPAKVTPYLSTGENANQNIEKQADIPVINGAFTYTVPNVSIATFVGETGDATVAAPVAATTSTLDKSRLSAVGIPGGIRLHRQDPAAGTALLVDMTGRVMAQWTVDAVSEQTLSVSASLPRQLYCLQLSCGGSNLTTTVAY